MELDNNYAGGPVSDDEELIRISFTREQRELIHKAVYKFQDSFDELDEDCVRICELINNALN